MTNTSKDWPITRAELLGIYTPSARFRIVTTMLTILVYLFAIGVLSLFLWMILNRDASNVRWAYSFSLAVFLIKFVLDVRARVRRRRWNHEAPRIWDADGCICPWCREDVRTGPCPAHGVGPEHRSLLIAFYSKPVLHVPEDKDAPTLIEVVPRPPGIRHVSSRLKNWLKERKRIINDSDSSMASRVVGFLKLVVIYYASTIAVLVGLFLFLPALFPSPDGPGVMVLGFWLFSPILLFVHDPNRIFERVCASCGQQCPKLDQSFCNECGKDLQITGATARMRTGDVSTPAFTFAIVFGLSLALSPFIGGWVMDSLPAGARRVVYGQLGVPTGYFIDIDVPNLTPEEAMAKADLVLHLARPGGPGIPFSFDRDLIGLALEQDLLPESYREKAARTTASATLELEKSDDGWEIVVTPRIDPSLLDKERPRFAFGGVSIDGGPWSPGASWTLMHEDLDPDHRARFSNLRSESESTYRVPIELPSGRYEIEARCWILLDGGPYSSPDLEFDPEGNPEFPQEAIVYDLPISATVEVP